MTYYEELRIKIPGLDQMGRDTYDAVILALKISAEKSLCIKTYPSRFQARPHLIPMTVMSKITEDMPECNAKHIQIALLHNAIQSGIEHTVNEIRSLFGDEICDSVIELTTFRETDNESVDRLADKTLKRIKELSLGVLNRAGTRE